MNRARHHRHVCTVQKHTPFLVSMNIAYHHLHVCTARKHSPISVYCRTTSPMWLRCRCFQLPPRPTLERHLGGLVCVSRTSPLGVGRGAPPRFVDCPGTDVPGTLGGTRTSVGYFGELVVLRDHGGSGCLYPFGTGGYPACYQCGVASTQCGGIGSPGAVVPLCQVTLLASSPSLHHAYHGSLVTPSPLPPSSPCVSPYPCA